MRLHSAILLVCVFLTPALAANNEKESDRVKEAGQVLKEIIDIPDNIPKDLIDRAECMIVLPSVKKFAIGVDANQDWTKPGLILTSMLKRVDRAVFSTIEDSKAGHFAPGLKRFWLAEHHGMELGAFDTYVPAADAKSFDEWCDATQAYQSALLQLQIEDLRRCKGSPCGGFTLFCLADPSPAVGFGLLDHERVPKRAYAAVRDACRPVLPMVDPRSGNVHVVNDTRNVIVDAEMVVSVDGRVRRWRGDLDADAVVFVGAADLGNDLNHLGEGSESQARLVHETRAFSQAGTLRQCATRPDRAFVQMREELRADDSAETQP